MVGRDYRFTYGLGVDCVCLATLHVGLHIGRWNQSDVMAEGSDLACPEVRTAAGFKADNTARQSAKEPKHLGAAKLSFYRNLAIRRHSVNLENLFGDIEPDCRSFNHGTTSSSVVQPETTGPLAHDAAGAGSFHNIKSAVE